MYGCGKCWGKAGFGSAFGSLTSRIGDGPDLGNGMQHRSSTDELAMRMIPDVNQSARAQSWYVPVGVIRTKYTK